MIWNSSTSLLDVLAASSGDYPSDELNSFSSYLAYQCYLINRNEDEEDPNFGYYHSILHNGEIVAQTKRMKEDGNQGEYAFSFGTNYKDKLYLGLTIGIQSIWYKMHSGYTEAPPENSPSGLDYYTYYEYKKMNGVGTNLKFGVIIVLSGNPVRSCHPYPDLVQYELQHGHFDILVFLYVTRSVKWQRGLRVRFLQSGLFDRL